MSWWKRAVVYQIYPRSFADSDGDGIGDLAGITARLDHLAALGVDVMWLSPIYPSPQDDAGYDISDYQDIDPAFGTLEEFDALLAARPRARDEAHHGPRRQPHLRRAPVVRRVALVDATTPSATGTGGAREPNDWRSFFSGSAWELDEASGEYYLHLFSRKQPDLNWENPEVRRRRSTDDALVAGPRGRRLPHGRHQPHLEGHVAARRRDGALRRRPARPRVPAGDAPRGVRRAPRRSCCSSARRPA